jgi:hypothetical protein
VLPLAHRLAHEPRNQDFGGHAVIARAYERMVRTALGAEGIPLVKLSDRRRNGEDNMVDDYCARRARTEQSAQNYCIVIDVSSSPLFVIVSGLPASGNTSPAEPLSQALGVPLISKDAIKEWPFEAVGYGGSAWSTTLSRAADSAMVRIAQDLHGTVLDSFCYAATVDELSTPLTGPIVEVLCRCDPEVPYERFRSRVRHPGHADKERDAVSARTPFFTRAKKLPCGR